MIIIEFKLRTVLFLNVKKDLYHYIKYKQLQLIYIVIKFAFNKIKLNALNHTEVK